MCAVNVIAMTEAEALLAQIAGLQREVADLQQQVVQRTTADPNNAETRTGVALNMTYQAPTTGYLSVAPVDGRTGGLKPFVGYQDPPSELGSIRYSDELICATTGRPWHDGSG